jgi:methylmalonyl-CoA carboxyltransferase large subunit
MKNKQTEDELLSLIARMREEIGALSRRVDELEQRMGEGVAAADAAPDEETLLAISAAVAAFLGVRARIRHVRLVHSSAWAQVGRMGVHASHRLH